VAMRREHLEQVMAAVEAVCADFPDLNAEFRWDGIRRHDEVRFDLDLGRRAPAAGGGTFTIVDYGEGSSLLGIPAVRPGQTAALRVGAVREGKSWLALTVDHRAVDGGTAGRFLGRLKAAIESGGDGL